MTNPLEARLEALETTVAYQDQTIEDLNSALGAQAKEIEALKRDLARMAALLGDLAAHPALAPEDEPPPPHY